MYKSFLDGLLFAKYLFIHFEKWGEGDVAANEHPAVCRSENINQILCSTLKLQSSVYLYILLVSFIN